MAQYKRLPRGKEKKVDDFVNWADHIYLWLFNRKKQVISLLFTCLIIGLITLLIWGYFSHQAGKASDLFAKAEAAESGSDTQIGILDNLVKKYKGTRSGHLARLWLGDIWLSKGEFEKSKDYYESLITASNRYGTIRILALHDLAEGFEAKGEFKEAASYYMRAYNDPANSLKPFSYFQAARCYRLAGEKEEAKKIYQELLNNVALDDPQIRNQSEEELLWLEINAS